MQSHELRVKYLSEALPYIQKFTNKIFVIKYGGSALTDVSIAQSVIKDLVLLNSVNIKTVLVHGGGPEINQMLDKVGKEIAFENGLRKTDTETLEIAEMVLSGKIQRRLVSLINCTGAKAIGLNGRDARIVVAKQLEGADADNKVGEVKELNLELIHQLFDLDLDPHELENVYEKPEKSSIKDRLMSIMRDSFYGSDLEWLNGDEFVGSPNKPYAWEGSRSLYLQRGEGWPL